LIEGAVLEKKNPGNERGGTEHLMRGKQGRFPTRTRKKEKCQPSLRKKDLLLKGTDRNKSLGAGCQGKKKEDWISTRKDHGEDRTGPLGEWGGARTCVRSGTQSVKKKGKRTAKKNGEYCL